ncbi:SPOR domain-containing protein [Undibacterium jejuense]|uniref:SPOR domain-containing protein n=1 Tax=Undibacterium jejuense TaxID=1344949 RepID=A0A923HKK9_9BURK|nr:SPOR domain-containing protein [Undibacterium jejuense]MBC3863990.1 SPOR domain-containing protein [Undibacterium jejuense]
MKSHHSSLQGQRGNTLTGLIIGLVIGLGIAVAVALLITKSSTPFTNKGLKSDKPDQPVTQLQDPNKPLYGNKETTKEVAKEFVKDPNAPKSAETAATPAGTPPVSTISAATKTAVETKAETKPAVDKTLAEKNDKAADVAKNEANDDKYIYFLQAGAFKDQADAEGARAKLALIGFEAKVSEKNSDTGTMYRVRVGPFNNAESMNRTRTKLSDNGVDVAVVRTVK